MHTPDSTNQHAPHKDRRKKTAVFVSAVGGIAALAIGIWIALHYSGTSASLFGPKPGESAVLRQTETPEPTQLRIPSLGVDAPFVQLGLNKDQTIETPKGDAEVGWFIHGAKPGDIGPAVVVGHLDSVRGPAVFQNLKNIKVGDEIAIQRADGSTVTYRAESMSQYKQDSFPTQEVYGPIDYAGLRLITCAGQYSKQADRYSDNFIVYGRLVSGQ
jgi:sortase (surface protein transpeptidase)